MPSKPSFESLKDYLENYMRMSHIYQPVMIWTLLRNGGEASETQIAKEIAGHDQAQIEYYELRVKNMVGRVLTNNGVTTKQSPKKYALIANYSDSEVEELMRICEEKIDQYIERRKIDIWDHRRNNRRPVPGSVRYKVLSRAKHKCELCGVDASERALEVDHIVPKSLGGKDDIANYQALCYKCNTNKGNRAEEDFRTVAESYNLRYGNCIFCDQLEIVLENTLAKGFYDKYAVTNGHLLIVPKRHCKTYFDLHQPEINAIHQLLHEGKEMLEKIDSKISGFNVGWNAGESAGQTIMHCHVHLIPRRDGDMPDPRGGVRGVIPGKQSY